MAMNSDLIFILVTIGVVGFAALLLALAKDARPEDNISKISSHTIPIKKSELKRDILWTFKNFYRSMPLYVKDFDGGFHFQVKARHYVVHYNPEIPNKETINTTQENYDELMNKINSYHYYLSSHSLATGWPIGGNANNLVEVLSEIEGGVNGND